MARLIAAGRLGRVPVRVHWTLLAACAVVVMGSLGSVAYTAAAIIAVAAYLAAVLIHEWGHVVVAHKQGCAVYGIELYPLVGVTRFEQPPTLLGHTLIAWAGVAFQGVIGIPMLIWIKALGYTRWETLNAFMAIFSYLTVVMTIINVLPFPPLDGSMAWRGVPLLIRRALRPDPARAAKGWNRIH